MSIFKESKSYRPFKYPWAHQYAVEQNGALYWDVHEVKGIRADVEQYKAEGGLKTSTASHEENKNIIDTLTFMFTDLDKVVASGYAKLIPYVKNNEVLSMLISFAHKEVVHQRAYAMLAEELGVTDDRWGIVDQYREMQDKVDLMTCNEDPSTPLGFAKCLVSILLSEGIGLFAAFTVLLNYKSDGILMAFNTVNSWSLLDESKHVEGNCKIVKEVMKELTVSEKNNLKIFTKALIRDMIHAENQLTNLIFKLGTPSHLSKESCNEFYLWLGRMRLSQLGYIDPSRVGPCPIEYMEYALNASKHQNFFEQQVTEYTAEPLDFSNVDYTRYKILLQKVG